LVHKCVSVEGASNRHGDDARGKEDSGMAEVRESANSNGTSDSLSGKKRLKRQQNVENRRHTTKKLKKKKKKQN